MNGNELESLSRDWPGVASSIKWEDDLVFTVAGKMFAVYCLRGPHRERVSFKVDPERFLELTDQPGISPAAYMARAFWISINEPDRFARAKLSEFVRHSYDLVRGGLSKKQQAALAAKERPAAAASADAGAVPRAAATAPAKKAAQPALKPEPATMPRGGARAVKAEKAEKAEKAASAAKPAKKAKPAKTAKRAKAMKAAKSAAVAKKTLPVTKRATKARGA